MNLDRLHVAFLRRTAEKSQDRYLPSQRKVTLRRCRPPLRSASCRSMLNVHSLGDDEKRVQVLLVFTGRSH